MTVNVPLYPLANVAVIVTGTPTPEKNWYGPALAAIENGTLTFTVALFGVEVYAPVVTMALNKTLVVPDPTVTVKVYGVVALAGTTTVCAALTVAVPPVGFTDGEIVTVPENPLKDCTLMV